ncbi:MAG: efflux RND transporter periplasmic adaptor subunit [Bacteroidetes bacterium]|nr:efflux RND transporter periplasmic adaptor subunit [Bacteroidota bacterium]
MTSQKISTMKYTLLIALLAFASCGGNPVPDTKKTETESSTNVSLTAEQLKNAGTETGYAKQQDIKSIIKVTGKIDVPPQNMVSVSFPLGGYLKSTKLLPGMHIGKGEVIAIMEDQQYIQLQQDYLTAKARQDYLENEYLRQKELNRSKASSDKTFQQAEAEYKSNKILISGLQQKLQLIGINPDKLNENTISRTVSVYAPIDGFVSAVKVNIGKYVTPSDVLFELVNPTDIHLALTIFEKDINSLFIGQKLVAYTNNDAGKKYPCEIILIGKDVSAEHSIQVHCHFDKYDNTLVPGMYMNAEIEANSRNSYVVPEDAVVRYGNKQFLFLAVQGNNYEMKEVTTGASENGMIAITNIENIDLTKQAIVTKNAYSLLMKLKNTAE